MRPSLVPWWRVNRVKPHTEFSYPFESGLMKMMAIGTAAIAQRPGEVTVSLSVDRFDGRAAKRPILLQKQGSF